MILFLDDEKREMDSYAKELELCGYKVVFQKNVDEAWHFFENNVDGIDLLILDIMMPPGSIFKKVDTREGLRTGVHFFERIRKAAPDLPVIILTNVSDYQLLQRFRKEDNCNFFRKEDYLPFELAEEVEKILK
ncbi:MAG: response regulator [bacterium]